MADLGAFFGNPNLQRQGARARALAAQRDVNTLADPRTYAIVQGLLGTAPDEMGFSVLNPNYEKIRKVAEPAFALGLLGQASPLLAPMTKGLPVGASVKPININKGIYKPDLTMEEMLKVRDIPTVDRIKQSLELVGEKEFEKLVNTQFKKYKPSSPEQEAMLVESVTLQVLGKAQRSPYPKKEALDTAQRNAALPIEEGGLGLPKDNTPEMRAEAMGYDVPAYRGSTAIETSHTNPIWWTEDPSYANTYAAHMVKPPIGQPDPYAGNVMPLLVKIENEKQFEKFNAGGVPLDPFSGFSNDIQTGLRRYPKNVLTGQLGGKVWEAVSIPENVRSRFAAFDPKRRNEADILAGVLPLSLLDEEKRKEITSLLE